MSMNEQEEWNNLGPVEMCLRNPPLAGHLGQCTVDLNIRDTIRVGDGHHAQVFIVEARSGGIKLVAKVYKPLCCDDDPYINPFRCVDNHYTHEVYTYHQLSDFQGKSIPQVLWSLFIGYPYRWT